MRICLGQRNFHVGDLEGNFKRIMATLEQARKAKADLTVFPELTVCGFPPKGLLEWSGFIENSIAAVKEVARKSRNQAVIIGYPSWDERGHPVNCAAFIEDGEIKGVTSKTLLPLYDFFPERALFARGKSIPFEIQGRKVQILIGEESIAAATQSKQEGFPLSGIEAGEIDLIINIGDSPFFVGKHHLRKESLLKVARKWDVPVVLVNHVGGNDEVIFDGRSVLVYPDGRCAQVGPAFEEGTPIIDIEGNYQDLDTGMSPEEALFKALSLGTRDFVRKSGYSKVAIGISGGIDSALTAAVAVDALGPKNVLGVLMPSENSSKGSVEDALELARRLKIKTETIPITPVTKAFEKALKPIFKGLPKNVAEENLQARARGTILMALSNKLGCLILATGNKSEALTGYCTLYGDTCGALGILGDISKTEVYNLARWLNGTKEIIPGEIISKPPSAELAPGQLDSDSLPDYGLLDELLYHFVDEGEDAAGIVDLGFPDEEVEKVLGLFAVSEFKRHQTAPMLRVSIPPGGRNHPCPVVSGYRWKPFLAPSGA